MNNESIARVGDETEVEDQWLTIKEVSLWLRCSHMTVRRWSWSGKIRSIKLYGKILISKRSITSLIAQSSNVRDPGLKEPTSYGSFKLINGELKKVG